MSLSRAARLALKLAKRKKYYKKELSSLHTKLRARGDKTEAKFKFKQKPKAGGGQQPVTTAGARYGVGSAEHKVHRPGIALISKRWGKHWPHERESWRSQMDRMYGGVHMSQDPKKIKKSIKILTKKIKKKKVVKALRGALIKKGTKLAFKLATKKYPQIFKKRKLSTAELKTKKIMKTPELAPLGVTKLHPHNLRKLAVAEVTKDRIQHLGKLAIKHNKKAVSLFWGKAKNMDQIVKLEKYHKDATKRKLESLGKQYANLSKYQETIKAKTATKHSKGGEIVFGKNVDQDLL